MQTELYFKVTLNYSTSLTILFCQFSSMILTDFVMKSKKSKIIEHYLNKAKKLTPNALNEYLWLKLKNNFPIYCSLDSTNQQMFQVLYSSFSHS